MSSSDIAAVLITAIACGTILVVTYIGARAYKNSFGDDEDKE